MAGVRPRTWPKRSAPEIGAHRRGGPAAGADETVALLQAAGRVVGLDAEADRGKIVGAGAVEECR
jgi:hypothetical protein